MVHEVHIHNTTHHTLPHALTHQPMNPKKLNGNEEVGIITGELQEKGRGKGSFIKAAIRKVYERVAALGWDNKDLSISLTQR